MTTTIHIVNNEPLTIALQSECPALSIRSATLSSLNDLDVNGQTIVLFDLTGTDPHSFLPPFAPILSSPHVAFFFLDGPQLVYGTRSGYDSISPSPLGNGYCVVPIENVTSSLESILRMIEDLRSRINGTENGSALDDRLIANIISDRVLLLEVNKWKERSEITSGFIDMFSHDIGLPLTSLKGNLEYLLEDDTIEDSEYRKITEKLLVDVLKINDMRKEALMLNKFDSGTYTLRTSLEGVHSLLQEVQIQLLPQADRKEQEIEIDSPHFSAQFDKEKLRHVLENLVSNAVKYTPQGGEILISAGKGRRKETDHGMGATFWIMVEDTGVGIPAGSEDKLFDRFTRFHKNMASGTGLGLSIVKTIIDLHKGRIWYEPREGGGSRFTLVIPRT